MVTRLAPAGSTWHYHFFQWQAPHWGPGRTKVLNRSVAQLWTLSTRDLDLFPLKSCFCGTKISDCTMPVIRYHHLPPHAEGSEVRQCPGVSPHTLLQEQCCPPRVSALLLLKWEKSQRWHNPLNIYVLYQVRASIQLHVIWYVIFALKLSEGFILSNTPLS